MMQQTSLQNEHVMAAEWEKADNLQELDLTATDLSKECLLDILPRIPAIRYNNNNICSRSENFKKSRFFFTKIHLL